MAWKSPQVARGVRWLAMTTRQMSRAYSPRLMSFTGGRRSPSWNTSVALLANEPTTIAPISATWPMTATNRRSSSPSNTGFSSRCSGRWQPARYGSLWMTTSPGAKFPAPISRTVQRTVCVIAPSCAGQNSPWPTNSASASNTAQEKSLDSLKMGE